MSNSENIGKMEEHKSVCKAVFWSLGHAHTDAHITKPFRTKELSETVKHLLKE